MSRIDWYKRQMQRISDKVRFFRLMRPLLPDEEKQKIDNKISSLMEKFDKIDSAHDKAIKEKYKSMEVI